MKKDLIEKQLTETMIEPLEVVAKALAAHDYSILKGYHSPYPEVNEMVKKVEASLQQLSSSHQSLIFEQEKLSHILSNMAEGFVLIDHRKNILLCNNSVRSFFNCKEDVVLQSLQDLVDDKSINIAVEKAFEKGESSIFEMWLHENLILNVYVSPTQKNSLNAGESGVTIFFVDMTSEKQLEKQKRDFFSNASHELKTPITSILGFTEMINQNIIKTDEEKDNVLKRIEKEAKRMSKLINDVLMVSNLESKNTPAEHTDFNLNEIVQEAIASVSPINNNEAIQIDLNSTDVIVYANTNQLYEMCVNLIENAVKYNKPGGRVSVELTAWKYTAILKVKDTGIGIPLEHQTRVFERFFRVDYGRDKRVGGSGLGLSIVKHIVNLYNGEISLRSKKDIGTAIRISLPIVRRQDKK